MNKFRMMVFLLLVGNIESSLAEVFVRVDDAGKTTYTNIKDSPDMQEPVDADVKISSAKTKAYKNDPDLVIAPEVQSERDGKRKQILEAELNSEIALLKSDKDREAKQTHERNIDLLKKELGR